MLFFTFNIDLFLGAIMTQKKYATHNALRMKLRQSEIKRDSKLATFLLDVFVEGSAKIRASEVYRLGLCDSDEKNFKEWRKSLCDKGWLDFVIDNNRFVDYRPGKKLLKYINQEKIKTKEIATKDELNLFATKEEVHELKGAVDRILNIIDPPDSLQKRKKFVQGGYDSHLKLIQQKASEI